MCKKAYIYPANDTENDFFKSMHYALEYNGVSVTNRLLDFFSTDIYILNWYETVYRHQFLLFLKKRAFLLLLRLTRKNCIVYLHNVRPHRKYVAIPDYRLSERLLRYLIRYSTALVCLSETSVRYFPASVQKELVNAKRKIHCIPHPNFTHITPLLKAISPDKLRLLSFGGIELYKGVEIAVEAMNDIRTPQIELWIVGAAQKTIQNRLQELSTNPNTHFDFRYIEEKYLPELFAYFDLCVYPLDMDSCLNSSSVLLAFSMQTSVICPQIATLDTYPQGDYIAYSYATPSDHIQALSAAIQKAYALKKNNPDIFTLIGENCYSETLKQNNQDLINNKIKEIL